jgi:hypothetical protein
MLTAARPPDGVVVPIWRKCHMGILLQAFKGDDNEAGLTVAIHLHDDGIHMAYDFGTASQEEVVKMLRPGENRAIYSAGAMRDIDVEVKALLDFVETFKTAGYALFTFNCQHFSTMLYHRFTRQLLSENLRRRWTSNKDAFGKSLNDDEQKMKRMQWASASQLLMEELEPVEGEPLLFYRSPPAVGRLVKGVTVVGAVVAPRFPLAGVAMFRYSGDKNEWYWSPYRDQEHEHRWISIHQLQVPGGEYEGEVLQGTSARIASLLANNLFNPLGHDGGCGEEQECSICLDAKFVTMFVSSDNCSHSICLDCFEKVDVCPFCRVAY